MPNDMLHEKRRWDTMTERQLLVRLTKIKDPIKLMNFINLASERNSLYLKELAEARLETIADKRNNPLIRRIYASPRPTTKAGVRINSLERSVDF